MTTAETSAGPGGESSRADMRVSLPQAIVAALTSRTGLMAVWALGAFAALVAALFVHVFGPFVGMLLSDLGKIIFIGCAALLVLPLLLLWLDPADNFQRGARFVLPFMTTLLLVTLTAFVVCDALLWGGQFLGAAGVPASSEQIAARIVLFIYVAVAFIPGIWNAANFARFEAAQRQRLARKMAENANASVDADAEAMGAMLATLVVLLIGALAFIAGQLRGTISFESLYGLVLCTIVIGIFAVVVFLDLIAETAFVRFLSRMLHGLSRRLHFLSAFYNWIDTGLVRIGASVAGMGQSSMLKRYLILMLTLSCLSLMAWFVPAPLGLAPALAGFILAIAVSRLWGWVEEDRALAAMTEYKIDAPYRVGFREDFRDETLLGFIFVFILAPIAMMQAHVGAFFGPDLFEGADGRGFPDWFGFFGVELAKAVPIVDWAEIYNISPADDLIQFESAASRHAVFLARVMVDMVLIASLLQAIGIATRNRQQKNLFAAKHIDRLDIFVERTELKRAIRGTRRADAGSITQDLRAEAAVTHFDLAKLGSEGLVDFRTYNRDRLFHLYGSDRAGLDQRAFIAAIAHQGGYELLSAIDLTRRIAEGDQNEPAMYAAFERALREHESGFHEMDANDIELVLSELRNTGGLADFKHRLIDTFVRLSDSTGVLKDLRALAVGEKADAFRYTRNKIADVMAEAAAEVTDAQVLQEAVADWQKWGRTDHRPSDAPYRRTLKALRAALAVALRR